VSCRSTVPALLAAAALGAAAAGSQPASATTRPQEIVTVRVILRDAGITLARRRVPRGSLVIFRIRNRSDEVRDFRIAQERSGPIKPGKTARFELDFLERTTWKYTSNGPRARLLTGRFAVI